MRSSKSPLTSLTTVTFNQSSLGESPVQSFLTLQLHAGVLKNDKQFTHEACKVTAQQLFHSDSGQFYCLRSHK